MPIPPIIGLFDTAPGAAMKATAVSVSPVSDGIFGQLLLLGVGRAIAPFILSPIAWRFMTLWL